MQLPDSSQPKKSTDLSAVYEIILLIWLSIFAFQMTFRAGERGFFAFDQAIVFDGGYRVYSGQIPYKDFLIPFGPVTFWLQGAIFGVFGVNYASYILSAALVNTLITGGSYYLLRKLFPQPKIVAYLGCLLTAVWFYPPFGTPWPDQTAFFFSFAALLVSIVGLLSNQRSNRRELILFTSSGLLSFVAFISKQNAGAFFVPVLALLFFVANPGSLRNSAKGFGLFSLGWLGGLVVFGLWLLTKSDLGLFLRYFFEIPASEVSADRMPGNFLEVIQTVFMGEGLPPIVLLTVFSSFVAIMLLGFEARSSKNRQLDDKRRLISITLAPSLFLYHNIFLGTSNNQPENSIPFVGLIAAISFGLLLTTRKIPPGQSPKSWDIARVLAKDFSLFVILGLSAAAFWLGANIAISRAVHGIFQGATFPHTLTNDRLSALKWGEPTRIQRRIPPEDINQLVNYLETRDENFFVFPDFTIFYGVLDAPSPQPLVWFHPGLTYSKAYDPELDAWIVSDLKENQVRIIVIEENSWFLTQERLDDFPRLETFLTDHFRLERQIGNFIIYVQKDH